MDDDDWLPYVSPEEEAARAAAAAARAADGGGGKLTRQMTSAGIGSVPNERNVFALLREHLKKRRKQAKDLYRQHLSPKDGKMDIAGLTALVKKLLPNITQRELRHFIVMVRLQQLNPVDPHSLKAPVFIP